MKAYIRKQGKNSYQVTLVDRGKRQYFTVRGTEEDAENEKLRLLYEHSRGLLPRDTKMTVSEYLTWWVDRRKRKLAHDTWRSYDGIIRTHIIPAIGSIPLHKLTQIHCQDMLDKLQRKDGRADDAGAPLGLSPTSVIYVKRVLNKALNDAVKSKPPLLTMNPATNCETEPKVRAAKRILSLEQVVKLLKGARDTVIYVPVVIALATGLRREEVLGLKWIDVDLKDGTLAVQDALKRIKGEGLHLISKLKSDESRRVVVLPDVVVAFLDRHKKSRGIPRASDHICCWPNGKPISPDYLTRNFTKLVANLELPPVTFHGLRHTHATLLVDGGFDLKWVSDQLGHSSVEVTEIYTKRNLERQKKMAAHVNATIFDGVKL